MADSENSRSLPAITRGKKDLSNCAIESLPHTIDRRNLLSVAARLLSARVTEPGDDRRPIGPTPIKEMWPRWYGCHQQRARTTRLKERLEKELFEEVVRNVGEEGAGAQFFADINRMDSDLDIEHLPQARSELRRRRRQWKEADRRLGYSATITLEHELAERAGILGRVMWVTPPSSLIEVTAKLHCLIVTQDPGLKLEGSPWPELRTTLKDLIRLSQKCRPKS